jgi:hypothetical protein
MKMVVLAPIAVKTSFHQFNVLDCKIVSDKDCNGWQGGVGFKEVPF